MEIVIAALVLWCFWSGIKVFPLFKGVYVSKFIDPKRLEKIKRYRFNSALEHKVRELYPSLSASDVEKVFDGLRQFFLIAHYAKKEVTMPSRLIDDAWHQFILFTDEYSRFCSGAFGKLFHHRPYTNDQDLKSHKRTVRETALRTWVLACQIEGVNCEEPEKLPLLFRLDADLNIENGNKYTLDSEQILLYREAMRAYGKHGSGSSDIAFFTATGCGGWSGGGGGGCTGGCGGDAG
ncbi:MAG: hypothetical protein VX948_06235 [Candidatus Latescibacterota bacterium]|nr:hypothetical protein [Candidatus Latescibacterota bacterium]